MEIFKNTNFDFLGKKWPFIIASLVLTVAGIGSLIVKGGPQYGIDFKGGTVTTVRFQNAVTEDQIRASLSSKVPGEIVVQRDTNTGDVLISTEINDERALEAARRVVLDALAANFGGTEGAKLDLSNAGAAALADRLRGPLGASINEEQLQATVKAIVSYRDADKRGLLGNIDALSSVSGVNAQVISALKQETFVAPYQVRGFDLVGPKVGAELRSQALTATLLALAGMLVYIAFRFEFAYGLAAVLAVFHDTIITIGLFSIFDKEISLTVIAALLTLVGFSMNDTIVVFDRIRENLPSMRKEHFDTVVNASINQTLSRTILTSGLTFITALSLWLFGGPVLNGFSFALVVGIIVGTFSSIFIASPILIWWRDWMQSRRATSPGADGGVAVAAKVKSK
ncbi:MAG TPA: protein translocase subunit SecF [Bryobacteraceae bacterium]|nr:protein translocase subunit SecF [Bryobacteraceae bacterium]